MRNIKRHLLGMGLGLLILISTLVLVPRALHSWMYLSHAVDPNSSTTETYGGKPLELLSIEGERWATWDKLERASAYHALVILPTLAFKDSGSISGGDGYSNFEIKKWQVWNGQPGHSPTDEKELKINYDRLWRTVTIDSQTYRLAKGNLFVIRYDENWQPTVTQVETTIDKFGARKLVIKAFKYALPEDKAVQQLYSEL